MKREELLRGGFANSKVFLMHPIGHAHLCYGSTSALRRLVTGGNYLSAVRQARCGYRGRHSEAIAQHYEEDSRRV